MGDIIDFLIKIRKADDQIYKYVMKSFWIILLFLAGYIYYIYTLYISKDKTLFIIQVIILLISLSFGFHFFFYFNFYETKIMDFLRKISTKIKDIEE